MHVFETGQLRPTYIINFPTKRHWKGKSRLEDIEAGLVDLAKEIKKRDIRSIAIPPLGSGLGGLDWSKVRPRIESMLQEFDNLESVVFEPNDVPSNKRGFQSKEVPTMTAGRAALVYLIDLYLRALLDPFVTLLEAHKLLYFMQEAGEPLRLKYQKALYGPYAENLRHVLHAIEGHYISGYADGGDSPSKAIELVPGATEDAAAFLKDQPETSLRFARVADLVEGFESSFGLELLSTVHWVVKDNPTASIEEVIEDIYAWDRRKQQFTKRQIEIAFNVLRTKGWIMN